MRVKVIGPDGTEWRLDTPDPQLVGLWLKALFDSFAIGAKRPGPIPTAFTVEIW